MNMKKFGDQARLNSASILRNLRKVAKVSCLSRSDDNRLKDGLYVFTTYEIGVKREGSRQLHHAGTIRLLTYSKGDLGHARREAEIEINHRLLKRNS